MAIYVDVITKLDERAAEVAARRIEDRFAEAGAKASAAVGKQFEKGLSDSTKDAGKAAGEQLEKGLSDAGSKAGQSAGQQLEKALSDSGTKAGKAAAENAAKAMSQQSNSFDAAGAAIGNAFSQSLDRTAWAMTSRAVSGFTRGGKQAAANFGGAFGGQMVRSLPGVSGFMAATSGYESAAGKVGAVAGRAMGMAFTAGAAGLIGVAGYTLFKGFERYKTIDAAKNRLENLNRVLEKTGKATIDVGRVMDTVNEVVTDTRFSLSDAFAVSTVALSSPTGDLKRFMTVVADTAQYTGQSISEVGEAFLNVANAGKVSLQDLNNQLSSIPRDWLAEQMGVDLPTLNKMLSKNQVGLEDLMATMEKNVGGFAKGGVNTIEGAIEQMHTAVARLGANVLGALFGQPTDDANDLAKAVNKISERLNDVNKWVVTHQDTIKRYFDMFTDAVKWLVEALGWVMDKIEDIPGGVKVAAAAFIGWKTITGVTSLVTTLGKINTMLLTTLPASAAKGAGKISTALRGIAIPAALAAIIGGTIALDAADDYHKGQQDRYWRRHKEDQNRKRILGVNPQLPGASGPSATDQLRDAVAAGSIPGYSIGPDGAILDASGNRVDFGGNAPAVGTSPDLQAAADAINRAAQDAQDGPAGTDPGAPGGSDILDASGAGGGSGGGGSKTALPYPAEYGQPPLPGETNEQWRARMQRIEAEHDRDEKRAQLAELEASGADEADLIKARNAVTDAEMRLIELGEQQRKQRLNAPTIPLPAEYGQGLLPGETPEQWRTRMEQIKLAHDVEQKRANLNALLADNTATQDEIIAARNELTEAEIKAYEAANAKLKGLTSELGEIGAALDADFGISKGLAGIAENITKFVANLAAAPMLGKLSAISANSPSQGGHGLMGILGAQGVFGSRFTGIDPSNTPYAGSGLSPSASSSPSAIGPAALQPPTAIPTGQPYGMPRGTAVNYGQSDRFPAWVRAIEQAFGVKASTYSGHQEGNRNEPGYAPNPSGQNRGIDWSGSVENMQSLADYLSTIPGALEQVIWQNPKTGRATEIAGGRPQSGYFSADLAGHQDHVHTRQSQAIPLPGGVIPRPVSVPSGSAASTSPVVPSASGYSAPPLSSPNLPIPLPVTIVGGLSMGGLAGAPLHVPAGVAPVGAPASGAGAGPLPGPGAAGTGTGAGFPGLGGPPQSLNPTRIGGVEPASGTGSGGIGMSGGGALDMAMQAGGMALDMLAPGAGQAAQTGIKLANRAIEFGGQAIGIGVQGAMDTFIPWGGSELASNNWLTKIVGGLAGAAPALPNTAGQSPQGEAEPPLDASQATQAQAGGGQSSQATTNNITVNNNRATEDGTGRDIAWHQQQAAAAPGM